MSEQTSSSLKRQRAIIGASEGCLFYISDKCCSSQRRRQKAEIKSKYWIFYPFSETFRGHIGQIFEWIFRV